MSLEQTRENAGIQVSDKHTPFTNSRTLEVKGPFFHSRTFQPQIIYLKVNTVTSSNSAIALPFKYQQVIPAEMHIFIFCSQIHLD